MSAKRMAEKCGMSWYYNVIVRKECSRLTSSNRAALQCLHATQRDACYDCHDARGVGTRREARVHETQQVMSMT